jgi:hypothetical protein
MQMAEGISCSNGIRLGGIRPSDALSFASGFLQPAAGGVMNFLRTGCILCKQFSGGASCHDPFHIQGS